MCEPTAASLVLGGAQAMASIRGQRIQAEQQAEQQRLATVRENERARLEASSMRARQAQERAAMAQRLQENQKEARRAAARSVVAAGEMGVSGLSVNQALRDIYRQEANFKVVETTQQEFRDIDTSLRIENAANAHRGNLLRINKPIEEVDKVGAIVGGIQTGLSAYNILSE